MNFLIVRYTKRIYNEVGINKLNYQGYSFKSGLLINPYKDCELLLLPIDILHELPIARSWDDLRNVNSRNEEKVVQKTLHGSASYYCKINDLDISPEPNSGRGPVDFKISRGEDKTVIEIKLTSNNDCLHGFEVQIILQQ